MPAKLSEKPADLTGQTFQDEEGNEHPAPITAVGYDANGEAVDIPVDTRSAPELPGFEPAEGDFEMFEGKRVLGHRWSFKGNFDVPTRTAALREKLDRFRAGKATLLLVLVEPGDVAMPEVTEDGKVKGVRHRRNLHVTEVYAADDVEGADALFEGGLIRVRRPDDDEDDGVGYLTQEPPETSESDTGDEPGDLAASLMASGLCGKRHRGHIGTCRAAAHACELPEAGEGE